MSKYFNILSNYRNYSNYHTAIIKMKERNMENKEEKEYWKKVVENGIKARDLNNYLLIYPNGLYVNKVKTIIREKTRQKYFIFSLLFIALSFMTYFFSPIIKTSKADKKLYSIIKWADENNISNEVIPRDIEKIKSLKKLNLYNITSLPENIGSLKKLTELSFCTDDHWDHQVSNNFLDYVQFLNSYDSIKLPDSIKNLTKLTKLCFNTQNLINIEKLNELENLKYVGFSNIGKLPNLQKSKYIKKLYIDGNDLKVLPSWIENLQNLTELNIAYNNLEVIPECISTFTNLRKISIIGNNIESLPKSIEKLSKEAQEMLREGLKNQSSKK